METKLNKYDQQAKTFTEKTGLEIKKQYCGHYKRFDDAKYISSQWRLTLKRGEKSFSCMFSQSVQDSFSQNEAHRLTRRPIPNDDYKYLAIKELLENGSTSLSMPYTVNFEKKPPTDYSVLACLQKYDVGTFENFCSEFGYNTDSRKAEKVYFAVQTEYDNLQKLFSKAELAEMAEIQ